MSSPLISVIIPTGPAHAAYVPQAVASCRWQSVPGIEVIVVNDTGAPLSGHGADVQIDTDGGIGPAKGRNLGIAAARGAFVIFLDADDYLLPRGIEHLLRGYLSANAGYVYSDVYTIGDEPQHYAVGRSPDYDQQAFARLNLHVVTALVPTWAARQVGGFDEAIDGFEDWTIWIRLAIAGICGHRIPQMTMVYRTGLGQRAKEHGQNGSHARGLMDQILARYQNAQGSIDMACCGGGNASSQQIAQFALRNASPPDEVITTDAGVRLEYTGPERGSVTYRSPQTGRSYRIGNNAMDRFVHADAVDIPWLQSLFDPNTLTVVQPREPFVPPPPAILLPDAQTVVLRPRRAEATAE